MHACLNRNACKDHEQTRNKRKTKKCPLNAGEKKYSNLLVTDKKLF